MMTLHLDSKLFKEAITITSELLNFPEVFIEKDYWVCYALQVLFSSKHKNKIVFKGGTSLSKCYNIIDRFSEDIDISFIDIDISGNQKRNLLKELSAILDKQLPEIKDPLTNKKGKIRKTVHKFEQGSNNSSEISNSKVVLESSYLGNPEPIESMIIQTYISEMMYKSNQHDLIEKYKMEPFSVNVQVIEKTFCEKIMSLCRFSYMPNPYLELSRKIRHIYDLKKMLDNENISKFFNGTEFPIMLEKVKNEDKVNYSQAYNMSISKAKIFDNPEHAWNNIKSKYQPFTEMIIRDIPSENEMLDTLLIISGRLKTVVVGRFDYF